MADIKKPKERDSHSGVETTGHEWDGIKELNNPAPRWWLWVFYLSVIFSIGYWVVYPSWPVPGGNLRGAWNWTQHGEMREGQAEIAALRAQYLPRFDASSLAQIRGDKELYEFARAGGATAFRDNCAACHGTGAAGGKGYPNLNDDDWLWGGTADDIYATLRHGIRSGHPQSRENQMAAYGRDGMLQASEIEAVADYVVNLHAGEAMTAQPRFEPGKKIFADQCAACHGEKGEGNAGMGAPRLSDDIWLYGGGKESVVATITNGRGGVMPNWEGRLDDRTIKMLAIYVHGLGGGQ